ncbi:MAG: amino acid adenylation domain-containing protein, partial [Actinomycetota bacterium]|nr:amino acid adenylation domain-containing protein [Actinomycetota bacterium]
MFTTMMAAFNVLMARYSGQDDIVIGTPTSGRKKLETRGLIGYFNNMLPLRVDLSGDPTFTELMQRVKDVAARALDHDDVPFEKMVDVLKPGRDLARNPLFQVAYSHQNSPQEGYELRGLSVTTFGEGDIRGIAPGTAKFDLTLGIGDAGEGELEGYLEYATDLFERDTVEAMVAQLGNLLDSIVGDPAVPLSRLALTGRAEQRRVLEELNEPLPPRSAGPFVHELVAAQDPEGVALVGGAGEMTFGDLERGAAGVAARLRTLGIGRGDIVAVALERSFDQVIAQLGAMKAGAAYLPLDPSYPQRRLELMVRDARPKAIVAAEPTRELLRGMGVPFVEPDGDVSGAVPQARLDPDDLAYVIYTSGSTGAPKGVAVTHANLTNLLEWHHGAFPTQRGEKASAIAPLSFDASVWEQWWPLTAGVPLVLLPDDARRDPGTLVETLEREGVTRAFVPTALAAPLLGRAAPRSLKTLFVGGDRITARPPKDYPARVVNLYGPAEATVISTAADVAPDESGVPHIGRPVDGARVYILDENLDPVPRGLPGEIYIGGRGVARGFHDRRALTAERFLPDPYSGEPGARMYRSGDRGRYRRDGTIDMLGRADDQVKVRGFRVEPAEVEAALLTHAAVGEAAVALRDGRLVGYVVGDDVPSATELRELLAEVLPAHMVPATIVALDRLPVTAGGKLDRAALPDPGRGRPDPERPYVAPVGETETMLADIWSDVLRVERIGRYDNFFDLGGDSILSIQIVARAGARGLDLAPKHVFEAQTVAELAALARVPARTEAPAAAERVAGPIPMTPIQRWFFEQDLADAHHFNQALLFDVRAPANAPALERALAAIAEHHDALRTRWHHDGSGWRGVVAAEDDAELLWTVDLSGLDPASAMLEMEREAARVQGSFDLAHGPLLRAALFDFGGSQPPQLLLAIHHLVVDAVSWGILVHDLATAYGQQLRGQPVALAARTASFGEWARSLEARAGRMDPAEKTMWIERVSGLEPAVVRRDHVEGADDVASAEEVGFELDEDLTTAIVETIVREHGIQPHETLLAVLARSLRAVTRGRHLLVDVEGHGREPGETGPEVSRTVGWFTTMFPVVLQPGAEDALATVRSARDQLRAAPDHGIGYGLLRYLGAPADAQPLRDAPQAEVSFNYMGRFEGSLGGSGDIEPTEGPLGPLRAPAGARRHVLAAEAWVTEGRIRVDVVYPGKLLDRETMAAVRDAFVREAAAVVAACSRSTLEERAVDVDLTDLLSSRPGLADAYPLSPMQQGLLFHSLYETAGSLYFEQLVLTISGALDAERLADAWQKVAARHPVLGASVLWEGTPEPVLLIPERPRVEVTNHDWRGSASVERDLDRFLVEDRARGFDLHTALARVALIRVADDVHRMVWSHHHLLLDGWSVQLLLGELMKRYEDPDAAVDEPGEYKGFVTWLRAADPSDAATYWRRALEGLDAPTDLRLVAPTEADEGHGMIQRRLDEEATAAAAAFARAARVTLNTVVEAAWGATLATYSGNDDVMFGALTSGRSAPVDGVERTVGLFINTVPVRVRLPADATVGEWLKDLQSESVARR